MVWLILVFFLACAFIFYSRLRDVRHEQLVLSVGLVIAAIAYIGFALIWGNSLWISVEILGVFFTACSFFSGINSLFIGYRSVGRYILFGI
jgi:hypothetical protein